MTAPRAGRSSATGGAACSGQCNWTDPNSVSVIQDGADPGEAKVFRAHAPLQVACENLACAPKLLASLQEGGDNLVDTIFQVLQEAEELRRLIEVDNQEAVKIGELEKHSEAIKVVRLNCNRRVGMNSRFERETRECCAPSLTPPL